MKKFLVNTTFLAIVLIFMYLCGLVVSLDFNPAHWKLFTTNVGRLIFVVMMTYLLVKTYIYD